MNEEIRQQIISRFKETQSKASEYYHMDFSAIKKEIRYDLTGVVAGQYGQKDGKHFFRVNLALAEKNLEDYLKETIPHEYAHFVAHVMFGNKIKAHGIEWQSVMVKCFSLIPNRCHDYDVSEVKSTYKIVRYYYKCVCGCETSVGKNVHNNIQNGKMYVYARCRHSINKNQFVESK